MMFALSMFSCASPAENKQAAEEDAVAAFEALQIANKEYLEDVANYRAQVQLSIDYNDSILQVHRMVMEKVGLTSNPFYKHEVETLEAKNDSLQAKMDNYKGEGDDNWTIFKEEFNYDMDELANALKDLTGKNSK